MEYFDKRTFAYLLVNQQQLYLERFLVAWIFKAGFSTLLFYGNDYKSSRTSLTHLNLTRNSIQSYDTIEIQI